MNWKRNRSGCRETIRRYLLVWLSVMEVWAKVDVSMEKRRYIREIFKRLNQQDGSDIDEGEEGAQDNNCDSGCYIWGNDGAICRYSKHLERNIFQR